MRFIQIGFAAVLLTGLSVPVQAEDFKSMWDARYPGETNIPIAPSDIPYAYTVTVQQVSEDDENEIFTSRYRFNPSAAPGERVNMIDGEIDDLPKGIRKGLERINDDADMTELADGFWCMPGREIYSIVANDPDTEIVAQDEEIVELAVGPESIKALMTLENDEDDRGLPKKIAKRMTGKVVLSNADYQLKSSHLWLTKPTTVKLVAKMKEMDFKTECELAPNGVPYYSKRKTIVAGKAVGSSFRADLRVSVSDLTPAGG